MRLPRFARSAIFLCFALGIVVAPSFARAQAAGEMGDHIHLSLQQGASPFGTISYAVRGLAGAALVIQAKMFPYSGALDNRVALVPEKQLTDLCGRLVTAVQALSDEPSEPSPFTGTWILEFKCGSTQRSIQLVGDETLPGGKGFDVLKEVIGYVEGRLGTAQFRDLVAREEDIGWLQIRSIPSVEVEVDGIATGLKTPILAFELRPGTHVVRLYSKEYGIDKSRRFEVKAGEYTNITVNFTDDSMESEPAPGTK